jgi:carbon-monoxide dehydrogenase iron sulfur subunit
MTEEETPAVNKEIPKEVGKSAIPAPPILKGLTLITRPERCLGCKSCEIACAVGKSATQELFIAIQEVPLPVRRIHVRGVGAPGLPPLLRPEWRRRGPSGFAQPMARPEHCRQCKFADCERVCKSGAIHRDDELGIVIIDEEKCDGCMLCVKACPFKVITPVKIPGRKRGVALKCTRCAEHPEGPMCVRNCPTKALLVAW